MTQTFRSREDQVSAAFTQDEETFQFLGDMDSAQFRKELLEAEARGAAEERGKKNPKAEWIARQINVKTEAELALASAYVNVAALEARVKELEAEVAVLKTPQFYGNDETEMGTSDIDSFFDFHEPGAVLEIEGYRQVSTVWAAWDGNSSRMFDTEEAARAALIREGGEP